MHRPRSPFDSRSRPVRPAPYALPPGVPALQSDPRRAARQALGAFVLGIALAVPLGWFAAGAGAHPGVRPVRVAVVPDDLDVVPRAAAALADPGPAGRELAGILLRDIDALSQGAERLGALRAALERHASGR